MIRVNLNVLVLIYLGLMLGPVLFFWLLNEHRRHRRERAAFRHVVHCRLCAFDFADHSGEPLPLCPRCGSRNERCGALRL